MADLLDGGAEPIELQGRHELARKEGDRKLTVGLVWKLASLGLKAGEKIWVPIADQGKLRAIYNFNEFEAEFATGIDLPKNYFENIDVVWKEEFRIDAAFEVENSTAIYSGLLRFAALKLASKGFNERADRTQVPVLLLLLDERVGFRAPKGYKLVELMRTLFIALNKHSEKVSRPREILLDERMVLACIGSPPFFLVAGSPGLIRMAYCAVVRSPLSNRCPKCCCVPVRYEVRSAGFVLLSDPCRRCALSVINLPNRRAESIHDLLWQVARAMPELKAPELQ